MYWAYYTLVNGSGKFVKFELLIFYSFDLKGQVGVKSHKTGSCFKMKDSVFKVPMGLVWGLRHEN